MTSITKLAETITFRTAAGDDYAVRQHNALVAQARYSVIALAEMLDTIATTDAIRILAEEVEAERSMADEARAKMLPTSRATDEDTFVLAALEKTGTVATLTADALAELLALVEAK